MYLLFILCLSQKHLKRQTARITITHGVCFSLHNHRKSYLNQLLLQDKLAVSHDNLCVQEVAAITSFNILMMQCERLLRLTMLALVLNLAVLVIGKPVTYSKSSDSSSPTSRCSRIIRRLIGKYGKEIVNDLVDRYLQNFENNVSNISVIF